MNSMTSATSRQVLIRPLVETSHGTASSTLTCEPSRSRLFAHSSTQPRAIAHPANRASSSASPGGCGASTRKRRKPQAWSLATVPSAVRPSVPTKVTAPTAETSPNSRHQYPLSAPRSHRRRETSHTRPPPRSMRAPTLPRRSRHRSYHFRSSTAALATSRPKSSATDLRTPATRALGEPSLETPAIRSWARKCTGLKGRARMKSGASAAPGTASRSSKAFSWRVHVPSAVRLVTMMTVGRGIANSWYSMMSRKRRAARSTIVDRTISTPSQSR